MITKVTSKFILSLILLTSTSLNSVTAQQPNNCIYNWTPQNSGTTSLLNSVKAVNESICWAAGNNGTVRQTTDGGNIWINANPNPGVIIGNISNIEAIDENNAWATTSQSINTFIYKTTNGGNNWVQVYSQVGGFINGINMTSALNGFAFGNPLSNIWNILVTTNGGSNWSLLPTAPSGQIIEQGFNNCTQVSQQHIWFGAFLGSVYRSTNNGVNWSSHPTPGINTYVFAVHFNTQLTGFASALNMVKSTNGGLSYSTHPIVGAGNINGIEGSGDDFWYIRGTGIYHTTNGGNNWTLQYTAFSTQLDIDFPDGITDCLMGWSVGYAGTISKMTGTLVGNWENKNKIPSSYILLQNYPNPFNPVTKIKFDIAKRTNVRLIVYDIHGRNIDELINQKLNQGKYEVEFNGSNLSSGIYLYKLITESFSKTKRMILVK